MKKKFVTLFPNLENIHLVKDVGLIPLTMCHDFEYDSKIVCFENDEYTYLKSEAKGLNLNFLPKCRFKYVSELKYIIHNAKSIDILNMYHLSIHHSLLIFYIYKILNHNGVSFLKLDLDFRGVEDIENYSFLKKLVIKRLLKKVDIVSAESTIICEKIERVLDRDVMYLPNGYFKNKNQNHCLKRLNQFITVGRLGTEQKATDFLIKSFIRIHNQCDWNLVLVGKFERKLEKYISELLKEYPQLKNRIKLTGEIKDKDKLMNLYKESKVFVLPSKWESFGLVAIESMFCGDYLIVSDKVPPAGDFVKNDEYGKVIEFNNVVDLSDALLNATKININYEKIKEYAEEHFDWKIICARLNDKINSSWNTSK